MRDGEIKAFKIGGAVWRTTRRNLQAYISGEMEGRRNVDLVAEIQNPENLDMKRRLQQVAAFGSDPSYTAGRL